MKVGVINISMSVVRIKAIGSFLFPTVTTSKLVAFILITFMTDMSIMPLCSFHTYHDSTTIGIVVLIVDQSGLSYPILSDRITS